MKNFVFGTIAMVLFSLTLLSFTTTVDSDDYRGTITSYVTFDKVVESGKTPLSKLSKETLLDFRRSLKFAMDGELATAKYSGIQKELSKEDYATVWTLFNFSTGTDYRDYICESPNNCKKEDDYICLSGCSQSGGDKEFLEYRE